MRQFTVTEREAGQRLDKYLHKLLPAAPSSFFYKMLRKKNITLNGKKAEGKEKLGAGDLLTLYLSDDTLNTFGREVSSQYEDAYKKLKGIQAVYENTHILIMNKPAGILSQKAATEDLSLNEWMIGYLMAKGEWAPDSSAAFKPSVCNRLDRNTSGLVLGAKSITGSQMISLLLKERRIRKFYRMIVKGHVTHEEVLEGYLVKDEDSNTVHLADKQTKDASYSKTRYYPLKQFPDRTLVEAELITGKTHQIRIHLAESGHPLLGDYKYGDKSFNEKYKRLHHIHSQLLYACRLEFPEMEAPFEELSKKVIEVPAPKEFSVISQKGRL